MNGSYGPQKDHPGLQESCFDSSPKEDDLADYKVYSTGSPKTNVVAQNDKNYELPQKVNVTLKNTASPSKTQLTDVINLSHTSLEMLNEESGKRSIINIPSAVGHLSETEKVKGDWRRQSLPADSCPTFQSHPSHAPQNLARKPKLKRNATIDSSSHTRSVVPVVLQQSPNAETIKSVCYSPSDENKNLMHKSKRLFNSFSKSSDISHNNVKRIGTKDPKSIVSALEKGESKTDNVVSKPYVLLDTREFTNLDSKTINELPTHSECKNSCLVENEEAGTNCVNNLSDSVTHVNSETSQQRDSSAPKDEWSEQRTEIRSESKDRFTVLSNNGRSPLSKLSRVRSVDAYSPSDHPKRKVEEHKRISMINFVNGAESTVTLTDDISAQLTQENSDKTQESYKNSVVGRKSNAFTNSGLIGKKNQVFV